MAGWESSSISSQVGSSRIAEAQRAFMSRVYLWMFVGLGVTALVSLFTAQTPALFRIVQQSYLLLILAELGMVFGLSFFATRLSPPVAGLFFVAYSVLNGLTLSAIFWIYELGSVAQTFFLTAVIFGGMSLYGTLTKKDLSSWGSFLFIGLLGVIGAGIVNLFLRSEGLSFVASCACVVVFVGLTAYDTQKLRSVYLTSSGKTATGSLAVVGALTLYLDFINIFLALLRLFGRRR
jgi:hypothetical protein